MYLSGRLHKPVLEVHQSSDSQPILDGIQTNLRNAVNSSLLLLPEKFSEETLYLTIAALSYTGIHHEISSYCDLLILVSLAISSLYPGDPRMTVGEDKNKVSNIVKPNMKHFRALYHSILQDHRLLQWSKDNQTFTQSTGTDSRSV